MQRAKNCDTEKKMDFLFVTITAITVSVDSFVAGFSLSLNKKRNLQLPMTVAAVTYLLCVVACIVGQILRPFLENYVKYFGAAILFALGAMSVVRQEGICLSDISFGQCVAIGVSVGFDGAAACLSLAVQGLGNVLTLPLLFAATHFTAVFSGQSLAGTKRPQNTNYLSGGMFFVLCVVKLLDL